MTVYIAQMYTVYCSSYLYTIFCFYIVYSSDILLWRLVKMRFLAY
jgi:hypothetical protein